MVGVSGDFGLGSRLVFALVTSLTGGTGNILSARTPSPMGTGDIVLTLARLCSREVSRTETNPKRNCETIFVISNFASFSVQL